MRLSIAMYGFDLRGPRANLSSVLCIGVLKVVEPVIVPCRWWKSYLRQEYGCCVIRRGAVMSVGASHTIVLCSSGDSVEAKHRIPGLK